MAVLGPYVSANMNGHNNIHSQLSKSLERILEDAYLCGELKLSGRKLKEFPKPAKFDLTDTVIADLSKNRFSEVPDEVTTFVFLEKLLLSQNVIKSMPDGMGGLQSLTYLDLSSNQLTEIPREICQMPLQVLLVNDNLLTNLPKDIGRMSSLAELDASNNRLTQVPMALGDCSGLKALDLSCNQLGLLPLQITYLRLEHLDVSNNCISSLPLELRNMTTLVTLNLDNNPLVSPPITVCMRGRVHIFKYLENTANKDNLPVTRRLEDTRRPNKHNSYLGNIPLQAHPGITSGNATIDCLRHKPRHVIDSGYCTDGIDKRWSNEGGGEAGGGSGRSTPSTPATLSPAPLSRQQSLSSEAPLAPPTPLTPLLTGLRISPEGNISNGDDRSKLHQQTYRQYKEALRQQRQQDIYRPREQPSPEMPDSSPIHQSSNHQSPVHNGYPSNVSPSLYRSVSSNSNISSSPTHAPNSPLLHSTPRRYQNQNGNVDKVEENKRPVQKVVPSRNVTKSYSLNGNIDYNRLNGQNDCLYTKPTSPTKSPTNNLGYNSIGGKPRSAINGEGPMLLTATYLKGGGTKPPGKMAWNNEPVDKLSFTMKREFDKQKEESDLLLQLRTIIESRLKVSLGASVGGALCDGVVLCHLANHVRPRAVASVHVPSPAQPKLTMARCRRNVENFIEACRKIGVEEEVICSPEDVMASEGDGNIAALVRTLTALLAHATPRSTTDNQSDHTYQHVAQAENARHMVCQSQTGSQSWYQHYDQSEEYYASQLREADIEVNYYQRRRYAEDRYISNFNTQFGNETIDEAEEYCLNYDNNNTSTPLQNTYNQVYGSNEGIRNRGQYCQGNRVQFVMPFCKDSGVYTSENLEIYDIDEVDCPAELRENMHRYDRNKMNLCIKKNYERELIDETEKNNENDNRMLVTCLCLGTFFVSAILLILFPL